MTNHRYPRLTALLLAMLMVFNMAASAAADGGPETVPSEGTGSGFILVEEADLGGSGFSAAEQLKDDSGNAVADFRTADPNRKYTLDLTVTEGNEAFPEDTESVRMSYPLQNMTAQDGENDEVSWTYDAFARQLVFRWKNGKQSRVAATIAVAADYPAELDISGRYVLVSGNGAMLGYETFTLDNRDKLLAVPATVTDGKVRPDTWQDAAWVLTHVTGDYYTIRSAETGKYLYISAKNENGYKANSLYLTQADEKTAQRIQAVSAGSGNWSFQLNKAAVNNSGNNPEKGFGSWTYAGSSNEVFHLYPESAVDHDPTKDLSGTWGIYRGTGSNHSFVANRINDKGRLAAIRLDVKDGVIYPQDDIPEWTFVHVNRDWYYVRCGSEYLNISNSGASLSDTPQALYAKSNTGYSDFALMTDSATSKAFALSNVGAMAENGYGSEKGNINDRTRFTLTDDAIRNTEISGTWAIVTESTGTALTSKKKDEQRLTSVPYAMTQNGNAFSSEGKIDEWTFTRVNGNWYTVRNQDGKYLDLTHERVTMSETETTVYIHESEGRYRLTNGGRYALNNSFYANSYGPKNSGNNLSQNEWHTLVHAVKEDMDILGFNLNGGTVNEAPAALELKPGTTVILPELDGTKNGEAFLGWSDVKDFYSLNPGTNHRYREVIRAGSEYTAGDGQETLYAVWNDPNKKVKFGIRENGVLQNEPSDYPVTAYKGHLWLDDALDEGLWVIDIDGTKEIKDYYMDNRVAASVKKLPTVAQIQEALRAEGSKVTFDPETQYIHWYVLKRLEKEWHVDGVIRNRSEISVTYNENVPASEKGSVQNIAGGYQFARGTEITIGAERGSSETLIPQRSGYVFAGWNTRADGTGDAYRSGETAQPENNLSLYARWMTEAEYSGHTVTYYVDGVQDGEAESHDYGAPLTARTVEAREGYTFSGWSGLPETMPDHDVEVTGSWTINRHQVKYIIDGVQDGNAETYEYGTELTARTVEAREGYTFSGWSGLPETMPDNDVEVTGSWTINSHQVRYVIDGVQDGEVETYEYGTELTARTVEAREGYTFSGWTGLPETMPDHDVEVTGSWTINSHQVTYYVDGVQDGEAETYEFGTELTARTVEAREGYTFSGWTGLPETMPDNDVEVTGSWTINRHQVKYIVDGAQDGEAETYEFGTELTARTVEAREGYTFSGWTGLPETMPDHDVEVTGSWTINSHQVTYYVDGVQDGEAESYDYGTPLTERTVEAREGYTFSGWSGLPETMPDNDMEVTGSWTINRHQVKYIIDGVQDGETETYEYGAELTERTVEAREGYTFSGWNGLPETMPDSDVEVTGSWTINSHQVKYIIDGVQDDNAETYEYGAELTARTVEAREGYTFSGWSGLPETMPDNDVEVTGSWTVNRHRVTYYVDGVQDGEAENHDYGTPLTARTVDTREGYIFSGWNGLPATMPDHDVEVTGSWTINSHQVKYIIDGVQDGEAETYEYGAELTARTVEAREGYTFSGWSGLPETMPDSDVEVTGSWTLNEYTVTFTDEDGTVLQSGKVPHGTVPVFEGQDPEKAEDSEHVYRYIGWNQEIMPATADVTYTAAYKALTKVILTAESATREYNAADQRISGFSCSVDGLEIPGAAASGNGKNAGTYETTFTGVTPGETLDSTGNYIVAELRKGTLTITPKAATIIVHDLEMTYGDKEPELTAGTEGTAGMDYLFRKLSREEGTDAGTYVITAVPVKDPNYTITVIDGTLTIHPRPVTVTAESKVKVYGSEEPGLTARIDGLADGDTADAIRFALTRTAGEDAGEYAIRASGEANQGNYIVTFADGNMTILPSDTVLVRIAANSGTFPYDGAEKNLDGYTVTEISNPLYSESDFAFTGSSELRGTDVGVYRTEMTGEDFRNLNGNFAEVVFEVTNGTLEITRRKITLTSASAEAPYNGAALIADEVTVDGDGFVPGEEPVVTVTGIRIQEGISENTFRWTFAEDVNPENYEITAVYGTLTVTPAITRTLTIRYLDENGSEVGTFAREYAVGEAYRVMTPDLAGYRAEQDWISGEMGDTDITATVNYIPLTYTLTVEFISEKDGSRVAEPVVLQLRGGQAFRVQAPETAGYTPVRQAAIGTMPNANRRITIAMIPDAPAEETGGSRLVTEIGEYGIPQGPMNNAAAIGDVYE